MNIYCTHVTKNGALCHDRTTSVGKDLHAAYLNERGFHMCLFGPADAPRVEYVRASNLRETSKEERARYEVP